MGNTPMKFRDKKSILLPLYKFKAYLKGKNKKLESILSTIQPDVYTLVAQRSDSDSLGLFLFDLDWLVHDAFGHAINFEEVKPFIQKLKGMTTAILDMLTLAQGKINIDPTSLGSIFRKAYS